MDSNNINYLDFFGLRQFYEKLKTVFAYKKDLIGIKGEPGKQGVSVSKIEQTTSSNEDSGINIITVTLSDGSTSTFNVKNGSKGESPNISFEYKDDGHLYVTY